MAGGVNVATLGLRVTGLEAYQQTERALHGIEGAGKRAQTATDNLGGSFNRNVTGTGRLNQALENLIRTTTGINPVVAKFTTLLGDLAVGGVVMTGVLLGAAALSAAYAKLTEGTRKAREEHEKLVESLNRQAATRVAASIPAMKDAAEQAREDLIEGLRARTVAQRRAQVGLGSAEDEEENVRKLTIAYNEQLKAWRDAVTVGQTLEGVSVNLAESQKRHAEELKKATEAMHAYARASSLMALEETAAFNRVRLAENYTREEIRGEQIRAGRIVTGKDAFGEYTYRTPLNLPPIEQIRRRTTTDPSKGTDWGRYGTMAQVGGGMVLGMGLAGNGAVAAGLGGALQYGAMGMQLAGPVGAVVGAVGGLVSGLIGHSKRAREEAEALRQAQRQMDLNLAARRAALGGDAAGADLIRLVAQQEKELAEARKAGMSKSSVAALRAVQTEERLAAARDKEREATERYLEQLQRVRETLEDISVRALRAGGQHGLADLVGLELSQRRERAGFAASGASAGDLAAMDAIHGFERIALELEQWRVAQVSALEEQQRILEDQLRVAQEQLREQQQTVNTLRSVVQNLSSYRDELRSGPMSNGSPFSQLDSARSQLEAMYVLARDGDATAAQSVRGSADLFLRLSRAYNASGSGYNKDFERVQDIIATLLAKYGPQLSTEEKILSELQKQTSRLEDQLAKTTEQIAAINQTAANALTVYLQQLATALQGLDLWREIGTKLNPPSSGTDPNIIETLEIANDLTRAGFSETISELQSVRSELAGLRGDIRNSGGEY